MLMKECYRHREVELECCRSLPSCWFFQVGLFEGEFGNSWL